MGALVDPFDVEALEKSVNDSAVRVSTIWASFLVFGLYLVVAAGSTTHRQLFLEEPIKLSILNIDLPLVGFFVLAPVLFVIFHAYVLVQVLLLARTAAAYDEAVEHTALNASDRALVRQRLANTLFAQIFAGGPRERKGLLGAALRFMAWMTLAIAPLLVLFTYEVRFLPYHSAFVTWTHRVLIAIDLSAVLLVWSAALDATRDVAWRNIIQHRSALLTAIALVWVSWVAVNFPGEPHAHWMRYGNEAVSECNRLFWFQSSTDRLYLFREIFVDNDKLKKIETHAREGGLNRAYLGERTVLFRERDLSCGEFEWTDLRRASFRGAYMRGAKFRMADLRGALLEYSDLVNANFNGAKLQETSFLGAKLEKAGLRGAELQRAHLGYAELRGANLEGAKLQGAELVMAELAGAILKAADLGGASLRAADLRGASLNEAQLKGANLGVIDLTKRALSPYEYSSIYERSSGRMFIPETRFPSPPLGGKTHSEFELLTLLQGTDLTEAQLQGAVLTRARLAGANLSKARLHAAYMGGADLQGARLDGSSLELAILWRAHLWRATGAQCSGAQVLEPQVEVSPTVAEIERLIERTVSYSEPITQELQKTLHARLITDAIDDNANKQIWRTCERKALTPDEWARRHAAFVANLVCDGNQKYLAEAIASHWVFGWDELDSVWESESFLHAQSIARALLGEEGNPCPAVQELGDEILGRLRKLARTSSAN
jgi:uncharacterized protein YjbI with pentapeptide repeats